MPLPLIFISLCIKCNLYLLVAQMILLILNRLSTGHKLSSQTIVHRGSCYNIPELTWTALKSCLSDTLQTKVHNKPATWRGQTPHIPFPLTRKGRSSKCFARLLSIKDNSCMSPCSSVRRSSSTNHTIFPQTLLFISLKSSTTRTNQSSCSALWICSSVGDLLCLVFFYPNAVTTKNKVSKQPNIA